MNAVGYCMDRLRVIRRLCATHWGLYPGVVSVLIQGRHLSEIVLWSECVGWDGPIPGTPSSH